MRLGGSSAIVGLDDSKEVPTMTPITTDDYKQAELLVMRRDAERHWRMHAKLFVAGVVTLALVALFTSQIAAFGVAAGAWLAALTIHYLEAIRWFDRSRSEFQGRVDYLAQRRRTS
jgi:hypothetical protein